ncbi:MAG: MutS-related protein, partial [Verrucomicrobiota bacterium]
THYHELTRLADSLPRLKNYSVAVKEWKDEIVFVRRVVEGAADRSYGIQVARLAGMPPTVVERARAILGGLESGEGLPRTAQMPEGVKEAPVDETRAAKPRARSDRDSGGQMDLFS